jgi:hypothetical protein
MVRTVSRDVRAKEQREHFRLHRQQQSQQQRSSYKNDSTMLIRMYSLLFLAAAASVGADSTASTVGKISCSLAALRVTHKHYLLVACLIDYYLSTHGMMNSPYMF